MREQMFWGQIPFEGGRIVLQVEADWPIPAISGKYPRLDYAWKSLELLAFEIEVTERPSVRPSQIIESGPMPDPTEGNTTDGETDE